MRLARCVAAICGSYFALLAVSLAPAEATTVTYNIDIMVGPDSIQGTLSTDGSTGPLLGTNILDWDLTINNGIGSANLTSLNSFISAVGGLAASTTDLQFPFASTAPLLFGITDFSAANQFQLDDAFFSPPDGLVVVVVDGVGIGSGGGPISDVVGTAATPLPATLPLFATGLGALGLLGWRRKRKRAA